MLMHEDPIILTKIQCDLLFSKLGSGQDKPATSLHIKQDQYV